MGNGPKERRLKMSVQYSLEIKADADVSISSEAIARIDEVKEIPLTYDFSETQKVMVNYIKLETTLSIGNEYADAGIHHTFTIKFNLVLKNGKLGVYQKSDWIKRSHLVQLFDEDVVNALESKNVIALKNRLQELSAKAVA
jgi:hypothetical protein